MTWDEENLTIPWIPIPYLYLLLLSHSLTYTYMPTHQHEEDNFFKESHSLWCFSSDYPHSALLTCSILDSPFGFYEIVPNFLVWLEESCKYSNFYLPMVDSIACGLPCRLVHLSGISLDSYSDIRFNHSLRL